MISKENDIKLRQTAREITEESLKSLHNENDNDEYKRISEPKIGQKVYMKNIYGKMVEVEITSGKYWSNGRLSNHWHWQYDNGEKDCGYGCFYIKK